MKAGYKFRIKGSGDSWHSIPHLRDDRIAVEAFCSIKCVKDQQVVEWTPNEPKCTHPVYEAEISRDEKIVYNFIIKHSCAD